MMIRILIAALAVASLFFCAERRAQPADPTLSLGVARFSQAINDADLLVGTLPPNSQRVHPETLFRLDAFLNDEMTKSGRSMAGTNKIRSCADSIRPPDSAMRDAAVDYWVKVGKCAAVDYVLVPQVVWWREREGGPGGAFDPASVTLDLTVVDVKGFGVAQRYHFNERQVSLSENLLSVDKFFARGGRWIFAEDLAKEGVAKGVKQLGL